MQKLRTRLFYVTSCKRAPNRQKSNIRSSRCKSMEKVDRHSKKETKIYKRNSIEKVASSTTRQKTETCTWQVDQMKIPVFSSRYGEPWVHFKICLVFLHWVRGCQLAAEGSQLISLIVPIVAPKSLLMTGYVRPRVSRECFIRVWLDVCPGTL